MQQIRRHFATLVGLGAVLATTIAGSTRAWAQTELATITASDASAGDNFGQSVAVSGDDAIIGAFHRGPSNRGAAYMLHDSGSGWIETQMLTGAVNGDLFGSSVAIDGDVAVVGAPLHAPNGAAYVYRWNGASWAFETMLTVSAGPSLSGATLGDSVAIDGNRIVVGSSIKPSIVPLIPVGPGATYVFEYSGTWSAGVALDPGGLATGDQYGYAVDVSGNTVVVGARKDDGNTGAVYVFTKSGSWSLQATLFANDATAGDQFGNSVAISGTRIAVGSPLNDQIASNAGAAYVFEYSGSSWAQSDKLLGWNGGANDEDGWSMALDGNRLVSGAHKFGGIGAAHIWQFSGGAWVEDYDSPAYASLTSDANPGDQLAESVSISGDIIFTGAIGDDVAASNAGSVVIFKAGEITPAGDTDGDGLDDATEIFLANGGSCPDPFNADSDGDGLSDGYENDFGPGICTADTDADGLSDGAEVNTHLTSPTNPDTDADGLTDGAEVNVHHTNPLAADSDGDGLSDSAEVNSHHTNPNVSDTDGDGLTDGQEINLGTNPLSADTDGDGLSDTLEFAYGTNPLVADTDGDGLSDNQEITIAHGTGCPSPVNPDSDGDTLNDGPEHNAGWDPCDTDSDNDGLADGVEVNVEHTNPLDPDSDHDGLSDGYEVTLRGSGSCPNPRNHDSDNDGIDDGNELLAGLGPCDSDSDDDGLSDFNEGVFHTNPLDSDSDNDGLLDGTEVDMAHGGGCPNPLAADSDGDTLSDGSEVTNHTNPCNIDTDGDSLPDNTDPNPLVPAINPCTLAAMTLATAGEILDTPTSQFVGPNNNTRLARKVGLAADVALAAVKICAHNYNAARALLTVVEQKTDGLGSPPDWIVPGPAQSNIHSDLQNLIAILHLLP